MITLMRAYTHGGWTHRQRASTCGIISTSVKIVWRIFKLFGIGCFGLSVFISNHQSVSLLLFQILSRNLTTRTSTKEIVVLEIMILLKRNNEEILNILRISSSRVFSPIHKEIESTWLNSYTMHRHRRKELSDYLSNTHYCTGWSKDDDPRNQYLPLKLRWTRWNWNLRFGGSVSVIVSRWDVWRLYRNQAEASYWIICKCQCNLLI